jgi:DGQHR domain-containing protein
VKTFHEPGGFQRTLLKKNVSDLVKYFQKKLYATGAIILAANGSWTFKSHDNGKSDYGNLFVDEPGLVIDGQHRIQAARRLWEKYNHNIILPTIIYHHLDDEEKVTIFTDINRYNKKIDQSLVQFLTSDSFSIKMSQKLNNDLSSPFYRKIALDGIKKRERPIKLRTMERGIDEIIKSSKLSACNEITQGTTILAFFNFVYEYLSDYWNINSRILNSYGIGFLSVVGREFLQESILEGELDMTLLQTLCAQIANWDWTKHSGSTGEVSGKKDARIFLRHVFSKNSELA